MYLDYDEYREMGGTEDGAAFEVQRRKAQAYIDQQTFGRIAAAESLPPYVGYCLKECVYELIERMTEAQYDGMSVSNDGVSVSGTVRDINADKLEIVRRCLTMCEIDGVPVLYTGV